jgi:lactate 2-monooxygenase
MPDEYGAYQRTIYTDGMQNNVRPVITTDLRHLEKQARKVMHPRAFNYIAGGAGEKATMDSNRLAFRQWKLYVFLL